MVIRLSPTRIDDALEAKRGKLALHELAARLVGLSEPTDVMRLGTAAHQIAEACVKGVPPATVQVGEFVFPESTVSAIYYVVESYPGAKLAEQDVTVWLGEDVEIHGRVDLLCPHCVVDLKFGLSKAWRGHTDRWARSAQWRAYSLACGGRPVVYHHVQLKPNKAKMGLLEIASTTTAEHKADDYTPGELLSMAVEAHEFMSANVPQAYAKYCARKNQA